MSHKATSWAILQRGLKPAVRVVLWQLADHHNPAEGCFPSQQTLAHECEMSVRSIRTHLDALEEAGLIRRVKADHSGRARRRSDRYVLGFEDDFAAVQACENASEAAAEEAAEDAAATADESTGKTASEAAAEGRERTGKTVSNGAEKAAGTGKSGAQAPANLRQKHRQNLPPNLVIEPVREPCVGGEVAAHIEKALEDFWEAYPRPRSREDCRARFEELARQGIDLGAIVAAAKRYAAENAGNKRMYLAYADNWLRDRRWLDYFDKPDPGAVCSNESLRQAALFWAAKIRKGAYVPSSAISGALAGVMVESGLVEARELRRCGVEV